MHMRFILREISHSRGQAWVFVLCVALSLVSIVALNSFRRDIHRSLMSDAKNLHGGDIIVHSHYPFSEDLEAEIASLVAEKGITETRCWAFYSVARTADGSASVLSNIKAVAAGYPLYGTVSLQSGRTLEAALEPGTTVVAPTLLQRLGLKIGDPLLLGNASLTIVDVVSAESQHPVEFFDFGPRILVSAADLESMGLVQLGSRVHYEVLLKLDGEEQLSTVLSGLQLKSSDQERVTSYKTTRSRVKKFFDNLLFFLSLISIFTLLLAGIGMQSGLSALLRRRGKSMAILRSFGATGRFLLLHYLTLTLLLTLAGGGLGILGGFLLLQSFATLFAGLLPGNITLSFSLLDIGEGLGLGLLVAAFFTFLPLRSIVNIKPSAVFRHDKPKNGSRLGSGIVILCGCLVLFGLFVRQLDDLKIGLYFLAGFIVLIVCIGIMVRLLLYLLPSSRRLPLALRQALRSMYRPGNATAPVMVTLACALAVLLSIELVENDLRSTYIASYPEDAPNLFCIDIQKDQKDQFLAMVGKDVELFPIIRARLTSINGEKIDRKKEGGRRGDSLAREFNLTYRDGLLSDELLIEGEGIFDSPGNGRGAGLPEVSVLDSVAEIGGMKRGDILLFNVQGLPLKAQVSSIRSRNKSMLYPFFYFVFPREYLEDAPQTFFAALRVPEGELSGYQNRIVNSFANVSTINVSEAAVELGRLMEKLSRIIDFFALFSLAAGGLILVSSILATRMARVEEGVYYKVMGARSTFVLRVFFYENIILAMISGCCGVVVAQVASWGLCSFLLDIDHDPNLQASLMTVAVAVALVVVLGMLASWPIIRQKPVNFLRELNE